jgi:copper resistance protein D
MLRAIYLLTVSIHILAMTIWIGGMLFLSLVIVPSLRKLENPGLAAQLVRVTGRRFRVIGWICLVTLVGTGVGNLHGRGIPMKALGSAEFWGSAFGHLLAIKVVLFAAVASLSVIHDAWIGQAAGRLLREQPGSREAEAVRSLATWMGRVVLLLSLAMAVIGVMLVRGTP